MSRARRSTGIPSDQLRAALGACGPPPDQWERFAASLGRSWPTVLRHRRDLSPSDLPLPTTPLAWYELGQRPLGTNGEGPSAVRPSRHLAYAAGDYYLQDAGSLLALAAADADRDSLQGRLICDLCAAPGGKASALVEAIGDSGFVLANEPIRSRLPALRFNLARTGSDRYAISNLDPEALADRTGAVFDVVLVDAPCSGQALLSRGRQRASALSEKQILHNADRQRRILAAASRLVRDGGQLVYSTCTFAEAENESQVLAMFQRGECEPFPLDRLDDYQTSVTACYRLWPHRDQCAGSFAASLRVSGSTSVARQELGKHRASARTGRSGGSGRSFPVDLKEWSMLQADSMRLHVLDSVVLGWPHEMPSWMIDLAVSGPELFHRTGQTWKPAHAAALRRFERGHCESRVEVDAATAKRLVAGEAIPCAERGWRVVCWQGRPLGWIKSDGSIGKNHLPGPARLTGKIGG